MGRKNHRMLSMLLEMQGGLAELRQQRTNANR